MATYYRWSDIDQPIVEARTKSAQIHGRTAALSKHHIFLSHSHIDRDKVVSTVAWLGKYSERIYVDWKDDSMPTVTSPETARRIKEKIAKTRKFILLATNNALASKWVPWELGVADKANGEDQIAILPVTEPPHIWNGNEYVGIYPYIGPGTDSQGREVPAVFRPGSSKGTSLSLWLDG